MRRFISALMMGCACTVIICGCSGASSQTTAPELPAVVDGGVSESTANRYLCGIWTIRFDTTEHHIAIEPARHLEAHYNVTNKLLPPECDDCIVIQVNSYSPATQILDIDVTLENQGNMCAHDVRGILYTTDYGHTLANADDWTGLFDIPGGLEINPFKAFAKDVPYRAFYTWAKQTENFQIWIPSPPEYHALSFAVDVSWPGTCKEPYSIQDFNQTTLYNTYGSKAELFVNVLDWAQNVSAVAIEAPDLIGDVSLAFEYSTATTWHVELTIPVATEPGKYSALVRADSLDSKGLELYDFVEIDVADNPNKINIISPNGGEVWPGGSIQTITWEWEGDITEVKIEYSLHDFLSGTKNIAALLANTGYFQWGPLPEDPSETVKVRVSDIHDPGVCDASDDFFELKKTSPFNLVDVTPPTMFKPIEVRARDNLVYIAGGEEGLYIFDASDPYHTSRVSLLETPGIAKNIAIDGCYAYLAASGEGLVIVDITDPAAPILINTVDTPGDARGIAASGDYAYVGAGYTGLHIIDVSDPQNAFLISSVVTTDYAENVAVYDGSAYVAVKDGGIDIIDVSNPHDAELIKNLDTPGVAWDIALLADYAYVAAGYGGLHIVDVSNPETACIVKTIGGAVYPYDLSIKGSHVYVANKFGSMHIIDISSPLEAHIIEYLDIPANSQDIAASNDYAIILSDERAYITVDTSELTDTKIADVCSSINNPYDVVAKDGYVYVANDDPIGLVIADVEPPESLNVTAAYLTGLGCSIELTNSLAYLRGYTRFSIFGVSNPGEISLIKQIDIPSPCGYGMDLDNDYVYILIQYQELLPINVENPGYPYFLEPYHLSHSPSCIVLAGDHLFIGTWMGGLQVLNVSEPEDIYLENSIPNIEDTHRGLYFEGDSLYVTESSQFAIYDVEDVEDIELIRSLQFPQFLSGLKVRDGFAYIAAADKGIRIIDVDPPTLAYQVAWLDIPGDARNLDLDDNYAYVACGEAGLRIIRLW